MWHEKIIETSASQMVGLHVSPETNCSIKVDTESEYLKRVLNQIVDLIGVKRCVKRGF